MGQYYKPITLFNNRLSVYNREVDGAYTMAKLTEHSWIDARLCSCIAEKFYHRKGRLAWVGDYFDELDLPKPNTNKRINHKQVWGYRNGKEIGRGLKYKGFDITDKFIVNHTKHLCIDMADYITKAKNKYGHIMFPLSLLTALGNGRGGGDYYGCYPNFDKVGSWAWDEISIEDEPMYDNYDIVFKEE